MRNALWAMSFAVSGVASGQVLVTEAFVGLSGPDGTEDWFELTNFGGSAVDTAQFFYDDDSADFSEAAPLSSILLQPGESAVFLIDSGAAEVAEFEDVWGSGILVGTTTGGSGLGQGGDGVTLFLGDGSIVTQQATPDALSGNLQTIDFVGGTAQASALGVNGAFESNPFENDDLNPTSPFLVTLVGSPGVIPAPGTAALLGLGGLAAIRRRR
ncbi:MAG: PEP-CTERM sorting domain-containing protein [Planctomycetota bacterium]